ncbi:MAG: tetratricopeptide repeat protein [Planctomycetota bacterium]|nr:tetratricopeptide repeat protein [Planctomycetaceae bacterium]MDQ3331944.1 tetratricopeptide repeat protein [Planctomycetota bacterium]
MTDRRFRCASPHTRALLAIAGFAALAGCNPMAAWTNNQTGKALYRAGRYADAREEFRRATADAPRNPNYIHNYATASRRSGDPLAAEQAYRTALHLDPAHQPSYHGLAVTLKDTGRSAEAHSLISSWVATQPYSEKPHIEMAWLQREMGDHTGAERSLAEALRIRPGHPLALANLGQIYEETGRPQLAVAAYQRSLASDWNQTPVTSRLARLKSSDATAVAIGPQVPVMAAVPGVPVTSLPPNTATAEGPTPLPPYHQPNGSMATQPFRQNANYGMASYPFQPAPNYGMAHAPFQPTPNHPLASQPFQPSPNVPLASTPFNSTQSFMNVPSGPTPGAQTAAPYVRAPR